MSTPIDPSVDPSSPPVASPAPGVSHLDEEIRQLARVLGSVEKSAILARKAGVTAVSLGNASTPPTITVDLDGVLVPDVRIAASYTPNVGDTVLMLRQGNQYFAAFKIADRGTAVANSTDGGFVQATLNSGHGHNANSGGNVMYRRVLDNGAWKMQWQGALTLGGSDTLLSGIPAEFRPRSRRTLVCARDATDATSVKVDFNTDGSVNVVSPTTTPGPTNSAGSYSGSVSTNAHDHGGYTEYTTVGGVSHRHSIQITNHGHSFSVPSHTHSISITRPTYIVFNGCEYFL